MSLNIKEKKDKVIELYVEHKTVREIAKILHMSFTSICDIIREYKEQQESKNFDENSILSEETKAIDLFYQRKTPIEVKIALNIGTEEVELYYKAYWKLIGLNQLYQYYETVIKDNLPSFLKLYRKVRSLEISNDDLILALTHLTELQLFELIYKVKKKQVRNLEMKKESLNCEINELESSINKFKNSFKSI